MTKDLKIEALYYGGTDSYEDEGKRDIKVLKQHGLMISDVRTCGVISPVAKTLEEAYQDQQEISFREMVEKLSKYYERDSYIWVEEIPPPPLMFPKPLQEFDAKDFMDPLKLSKMYDKYVKKDERLEQIVLPAEMPEWYVEFEMEYFFGPKSERDDNYSESK